ncbi:hypothetical protein [Nocardia sp. NPDC004260]
MRTVVLGVVLLAAGVVALVRLRAWWRDYGGPLVIVAYLQYLGVAATIAWWGLSGVLPLRDRLGGVGHQTRTAVVTQLDRGGNW